MTQDAIIDREIKRLDPERQGRAVQAISCLETKEAKIKFLEICNLFPDAPIFWHFECSDRGTEAMAILESSDYKITVE